MEHRRLFLYMSFGLLCLLVWSTWQQDYHRPAPTPAATVAQQPGQPVTPAAPAAPGAPAGQAPAAEQAGGQAQPAQAQPSGETIKVVTDLLEVTISTLGGEIRNVRLRAHKVAIDDPTPFTLMNDERPKIFTAQSGLQADNAPAPGPQAVYQAQAKQYVLADNQDTLVVPLVWTSDTGIQVTKRYVFKRDRYVATVEHEVRNDSGQPWQGYQYVQLRRTPEETSGSIFFVHTYTGGILHSPENRYEKLSFEDLAKGRLQRDIEQGWLAMIQHYFLAAWIPPSEGVYRYYAQQAGEDVVFGASSSWKSVAPGATASFSAQFYAGPKEQDRLEAIAPDLELTVDYGKLTFIAKPLYWLLEKIHDFVGNWGWAIVILTLLIKIVFYKLSETSYRSMARMRTLQPKMQSLKERFGDDRQRLNQELMELYKKEKINPLGGCLPILVQIPVFIALYWMLLESVELRHADWILWINDLSSPDPYFVLPILMGVTMFLQQRLNPAPLDPVQQKIFMAMPIVFTVFFLFFPAGLVLYWITNNILSIAQQWIITKRIEGGAKA